MSNINNPHDKFFKETFSRPEIVRDFLQNYLPAELVNLLNLDSLELQKDNFVDDDLQEHFSDLLYKVQLHDGRFAYIYFLFEHKSYPTCPTSNTTYTISPPSLKVKYAGKSLYRRICFC